MVRSVNFDRALASSLRLLGCTHVVNAAPAQVKTAEGLEYLDIDLDDRVETVDMDFTRHAFHEAATFIENAMAVPGNVVYVHCAGGVSRSASIVLAWMVIKRAMRLCEAWRLLHSARSVIGPNAQFMNALLDQEVELLGKETMKRPLSEHQRSYTCLE